MGPVIFSTVATERCSDDTCTCIYVHVCNSWDYFTQDASSFKAIAIEESPRDLWSFTVVFYFTNPTLEQTSYTEQ